MLNGDRCKASGPTSTKKVRRLTPPTRTRLSPSARLCRPYLRNWPRATVSGLVRQNAERQKGIPIRKPGRQETADSSQKLGVLQGAMQWHARRAKENLRSTEQC